MNMNKQERVTPYYLIYSKKFDSNCLEVENAFRSAWGDKTLFGYSVKTNSYPALIKFAKKRGWLAEVVSTKEMLLAQKCGFGDGEIICNGPVKGKMLVNAIKKNQILNLDNMQEVQELCLQIKKERISIENLQIGIRGDSEFVMRMEMLKGQ